MQKIRKEGIFSRWGGEVFMVLLVEKNYSDAMKIPEKLRAQRKYNS